MFGRKLWLLDQLFKKHVYGVRAGGEKVYNVFHNQFLVALKRFQVDKQELVHKSANETVMASTYTRIKAIPIGHIRLINGDNLDTQTPMRYPQYLLVKVKGLCTYISNLKTTLRGIDGKMTRRANQCSCSHYKFKNTRSFCCYLRSDCCNACPPRKRFLITSEFLLRSKSWL
ncbi:uncharacterized protein LOC106433750 [Brassica napus]|uniref:uncharacterized protein LOC106433750 n=1 Tax=Brassica napus TaxID=3708 RepID=UPI002078C27E|nr:uncharacterized protein LOC106433750 [Brassica napus]